MSQPNSIQIAAAHLPEYLPDVRSLFREYERSLDVDLCFQGFEQELAGLPGRYAPPEGCLLLALEHSTPAGCVAMRKLQNGICEMKRLYVRPQFRRRGVGRLLATALIQAARQAGYTCLRLDTLPSMQQAIALYQSLKFQPAKPYYETRGVHSVFLELKL